MKSSDLYAKRDPLETLLSFSISGLISQVYGTVVSRAEAENDERIQKVTCGEKKRHGRLQHESEHPNPNPNPNITGYSATSTM